MAEILGREYFDASESFQFTDLDILFYGTAVQEANAVFLQFWNDDLSYSVTQLLGSSSTAELAQLRQHYELDAVRKNNVENRIEYAQKVLSAELKQNKFAGQMRTLSQTILIKFVEQRMINSSFTNKCSI